MSPAIIVAFIAVTFLAFAVGYLAGWLDGRERQHHLQQSLDWMRRATTEGETEC